MPQVQYLPNQGLGAAAGKFGAGIIDQYTEGMQRGREEDALQEILNNITPGMEEEDVLKQVMGARGLSMEKKKTVSDMFSQSKGRAQKLEVEKLKAQRETAKFDIQTKQREDDLDIKRERLTTDIAKMDQKERMEFNKKSQPIEVAMETVDEMLRLRAKRNLGKPAYLLGNIPYTQTSEDVGAYTAAAKSLIGAISTVPVRNRLEFETFANELKDPYLTDTKANGLLNEIKRKFMIELEFLKKKQSKQEDSGNEMPPASGNLGRRLFDRKENQWLVSDGENWTPEGN